VQEEFGDVPGVGVEEVRRCSGGKPVQLIDARPKHFVSRQQDIAEGAVPGAIPSGCRMDGELSKKEKPVVVYCAYGFHVGCRTAITLRDAGFDARYMNGGHSGWKASALLLSGISLIIPR
jgi:Fe-Mn family superoxide dismutase